MPDVPVAAPAPAAPAAAPSSAPVSTPSTLSSTPAPVSAPDTPVSTPESTPSAEPNAPAVETPAADAKPGKPDRSAYGDDIEKFLKDTYAWEETNPEADLITGDEIPIEVDAEAEAKAADEAAKAGEEGEEKVEAPVEAAAPTPEALSKLLEETPGLKDVLEAHPAAKGALFAMARKNAVAEPILKLLPNVEAAQFAVDNANQFVGLKTAFTLSDSPEKMKDAAAMFLEQFAITDNGKPVLDEKGNPTYGDDLPLFVSEIKQRDTAVRIDDLKSRISAGTYATAQGKENDEQLLAAYEFIAAAEAEGPGELDKPDTSQMSPEAKAYFDKQQAEIDAQREQLGIKSKALTEKQRVETRAKFDTQYREQFGGSAGKYIANYLKQKETDGVAVPRYMLQMKDPKTGVSVFALQAFQRLNQKLESLPNVKSHSATLQMNALSDQALAARVTYGQGLIDEHLPGVIDDLLKEAGISMVEDGKQKIADREQRRSDARVEPAGGGPVTPKNMNDAQVYELAKKNVAAKNVGKFTAPEELMRQNLIERDRLMSQR